MGFNSSTPSWSLLAHLRKRGQRPFAGIFITDHEWQRRSLGASGAFALGFPDAAQGYLIAGLDVVVIANYCARAVDVAQQLAAANPRYLATYWRGQGLQVVIEEGV